MNHLVTTGLLIELYPMVPFVPLVLITQSVYIGTASAWTPATRAEANLLCVYVPNVVTESCSSVRGPAKVSSTYNYAAIRH